MKFVLSGNLLRFCNFQNEIELGEIPATLRAGVDRLVSMYPALKQVLLDGRGNFRHVHRIFLNGELIDRDGLSRGANVGDELTILTAIAGG